ncbi:hypothetical protein GV828_11030 [Flavobacterium sp. NST-5]|uniref:Uncharacterized protein n=1 Tax=Flavobacterium ichthyis TaxID=2698827 RepID=A0ABW9ZA22_9FLAO|nr:hypothetical protein [Flavobacterium ichthyis]NBL65733.1 hypothetical protein [Flavobacterium ichthyis]
MKSIRNKTFAIVVFALTLISCEATRTAVFDQYSYQRTTELKVETSRLMDKAITPFAQNKPEINALLLNIEKLKEYEKNKPNNEITFAMWNILSDSEKNLLGGFFKKWKENNNLSPAFVSEAKKQITEAIDLLIQYEIKKDQTSKDNLMNLLSNF